MATFKEFLLKKLLPWLGEQLLPIIGQRMQALVDQLLVFAIEKLSSLLETRFRQKEEDLTVEAEEAAQKAHQAESQNDPEEAEKWRAEAERLKRELEGAQKAIEQLEDALDEAKQAVLEEAQKKIDELKIEVEKKKGRGATLIIDGEEVPLSLKDPDELEKETPLLFPSIAKPQLQIPSQHVSGTAILSKAYVAAGGARASEDDVNAVQIHLMNVLRSSDTSLESRAALLEKVISSIDTQRPSVLTTPAGYFGHDSISGSGRYAIPNALFSREQASQYLTKLKQQLPKELLLVAGLDWPYKQTIHFIQNDSKDSLVVVRHESTPEERLYEFAGLKLFGLICGEFMLSKDPTYSDGSYFLPGKDLSLYNVDVVLNPAHIEVKTTQNSGADTRRFPFEASFRKISDAGAACFLAHHHPNETGNREPWPKSNSYSTWGIFAGSGSDEDWMEHNGSGWTPYDQLIRVISVP